MMPASLSSIARCHREKRGKRNESAARGSTTCIGNRRMTVARERSSFAVFCYHLHYLCKTPNICHEPLSVDECWRCFPLFLRSSPHTKTTLTQTRMIPIEFAGVMGFLLRFELLVRGTDIQPYLTIIR